MRFCLSDNFNKFIEFLQNLDSNISNFNAIKITNFGIVQGVGFRPFIYNLAKNLHLNGYVKNLGDAAEILLYLDSKKLENIELFFCALLDICVGYFNNNLDSKVIINRYFKKKDSILNNIFLPKNANIESIDIDFIHTKVIKNFSILESSFKKHNILEMQLPLDYRICNNCLKDLHDKSSRFYNYPFTTCLNCGARYSLLKNLPYDRKNTTMQDFMMCECCKNDYESPQNRRFHTQPLSCPNCAITLSGFYLNASFLQNLDCNISNFNTKKFYNLESIKECVNALNNGKIVLFKSLGGYAYLADARNNDAILQIREIKKRKTKPFAVMGKLKALQKIAILDKTSKDILESNETPILITLKSKNYDLSNFISPFESIGVMIPYTGTLELIFSFLDSNFIMLYTSANKKGDMIAKNLDELFTQNIIESCTLDIRNKINLENLEFFILENNREIAHRLDDSIINNLHFNKNLQNLDSNKNTKKILDSSNSIFNLNNSKKHNFIRISRGYSPKNFHFDNLHLKEICASFGAMQKSSLCFGKGSNVVISPYLGDLFSLKNVEIFMDNFKFFSKIYGMPKVFITDKHDAYESSKLAKKIAQNMESKIEILSIYHHHAHLNALLLESKLTSGLGVIFDGSGLGRDNSIWGGEFLSGDFSSFNRLLCFKPFRILGGEKHIKDCKRLTLSYALSNNIKEILEILQYSFGSEYKILETMHKNAINSPLTSSAGRLFDIAGFILSLDFHNLDSKLSFLESLEYEGQSGEIIANVALKYLINSNKIQINNRQHINIIESRFNPYPYEISNNEINLAETIKNMFLDSKNSLNYNLNNSNKKLENYELKQGKIALRFIDTLCFVILDSIKKIGADFALFGGGVFANYLLNARLKSLLDSNKIGYFFPQMPCNDYAISLGQIAFVNAN